MKFKNILFVLSFLIFSNCFLSIGQKTNNANSKTKEGLNEADFLKAKEGYLKMSLSEDYILLRESSMLFAVKSNNKINLDVLKTEEEIMSWLNENYTLTHFKTPKEGQDLIKLIFRLEKKLNEDYKEIFELAAKGSFAQKKEIYEPEFGTDSDTEKIRSEKQKIKND